MGLEVKGLDYNWDRVMTKKTKIVDGLTKGIEGLFKKNKVDYVKGYGSFSGSNTIAIDNGQSISANNIIIATGSEPSVFPGFEYDETTIVSSTGALSLQKVPDHLIIIGGGVIGLEMGSVYQRMGSKVTVLEYMDGITPGIDREIAKKFQQILTKQGIKIMTGQKVIGHQRIDG